MWRPAALNVLTCDELHGDLFNRRVRNRIAKASPLGGHGDDFDDLRAGASLFGWCHVDRHVVPGSLDDEPTLLEEVVDLCSQGPKAQCLSLIQIRSSLPPRADSSRRVPPSTDRGRLCPLLP